MYKLFDRYGRAGPRRISDASTVCQQLSLVNTLTRQMSPERGILRHCCLRFLTRNGRANCDRHLFR